MVLSASRRRDNNTRDMLSYRTSIRHGTKLSVFNRWNYPSSSSQSQWKDYSWITYSPPSHSSSQNDSVRHSFFSFLFFLFRMALLGWELVGGLILSTHTRPRYIHWFVSRKYNTVAAGSRERERETQPHSLLGLFARLLSSIRVSSWIVSDTKDLPKYSLSLSLCWIYIYNTVAVASAAILLYSQKGTNERGDVWWSTEIEMQSSHSTGLLISFSGFFFFPLQRIRSRNIIHCDSGSTSRLAMNHAPFCVYKYIWCAFHVFIYTSLYAY